MSARRIALVGALTTLALAGCGGSEKEYQAVQVAAPGLDKPVRIGVIFSSTSDAGEGADHAAAAAGARVAAYRIGMDGDDVELVVLDDHGTEQGATDAAAVLEGKKVDAVVYASTGEHVAASLPTIEDGGTCVLLPYADSAGAGKTTWSTGPSVAAQASALGELLSAEDLAKPLVITDGSLPTEARTALADGGKELEVRTVEAVTDLRDVRFGDLSDDKAAAKVANVTKGSTGKPNTDADRPVVIWAAAELSAELVATVQGAGHTGPTIVGPSALTPKFDAALGQISEKRGTVSAAARYLAVGEPDTATGARGANFTAAQAIVAQDAGVKRLDDDQPLGAAAFDADQPSHDAVVAIVAAARAAGDGEICKALAGLKVDGADGLAGPDLDFSDQSAYPAGKVVELQAAMSRRDNETQALTWFAVPMKGEAGK